MMWGNKCCNEKNILGSIITEAPTTEDSNYPPGYITWTEDGDVYFHIGSGQWVKLSGGGGGGGGVESINGATGAVTIVATPPITIDKSGNTITIGSTGGGSSGVQSIVTDNGTATPDADGVIEIHGVSTQGTSTSAP